MFVIATVCEFTAPLVIHLWGYLTLSLDSSNRTTRPGDTIKLQRLFKILPKKKKKVKGRIHSKTKDENRKKIPKLKVKCISSKKKYDRSLKINNSFIE